MTQSKEFVSMPDTMLAAQITEVGKPYTVHRIPTPSLSAPSLGPYDLLLRISTASLCHSDLMVLHGRFPITNLPLTASHEAAGTVIALGSSVSPSDGFSPGSRVIAGINYARCGACAQCRGPDHRTQYCAHVGGLCGISRDGAFAEYMVCDAREASLLPDAISFETAAPLACAGITSFRGVKVAGLEAGQWLGIVGAGGGLGHLGVQFARARGWRVVGLEAREEGLELARECGCEAVVDVRKGKEACVEEVRRVTGGEGVDACVNVSGHPEAAGLACAVTKMHGTMVQVAVPDEFHIPWSELIMRDIHIKGSYTASKAEAAEMLRTVAEHGIKVRSNVFHGLEEIPKLMELAESGKMMGKAIVVVNGDLKKGVEQENI